MAKNLVIVESPAKAKTIKKFLGTGYDVIASQGHVRDLPKSQMGVSPEDDFEPKYITIRGKGEILSELRKAAKKADKIYLATDPDREGEAISWHLQKLLKLNENAANRITLIFGLFPFVFDHIAVGLNLGEGSEHDIVRQEMCIAHPFDVGNVQ